ncbi:hypothetical protein So717_32630 [Roseobacter cerasinus]|uniref:Lipoprotein n=1 Tax=Roseobacter cerasinus TaxID=2602289 RepID=A0A640VVS7_9RHOB|nr:hypothetical protein [Roseobacter cerasinus]GFE51510.1 hypothetical protein So717_32630 [Roseobacter cerasinus]
MDTLPLRPTPARLLLAGVLLLTACGEQGGGVWYREAGSQLDAGEYGAATMQNMIAQVCFPQGHGSSYRGGKIGAPVGDPVVVLDPSSTRSTPVFRVHCDGRLDGKYAQVVYNDYVGSAAQKTAVDTATGTAE